MRENFETALHHVFREEGDLSNHPHDPGGLTKYGITLPVLTQARGRDSNRTDLLALTREEAATIYRAQYWDAVGGDELPPGVDLFLFDFAVNSGPSRALRIGQGLVGATMDGRYGPQTRAAFLAHDPKQLINELHRNRLAFLRSLSVWRFFGKGWSRRNDRTRKAALALVIHPSLPPLQERILSMANSFETTKSILQSRTVWANVIGLVSIGLSALGYGTLDVGGLTEAILQTVTAGGFVASTLFRIGAKARLA